jgi:hypothetical protein
MKIGTYEDEFLIKIASRLDIAVKSGAHTSLPLDSLLDQIEGSTIGPKVLQSTFESSTPASGLGFAMSPPNREVFRIEQGEVFYANPFIFQDTDSTSIFNWPWENDSISEARKIGLTKRLLDEVGNGLIKKMNLATYNLLFAAAESNGAAKNAHECIGFLREMLTSGWRMSFGKGVHGWYGHKRYHLRSDPTYVKENMGLLIGPKEEIGIWHTPEIPARLFCWASAQDLKFGIGMGVARGAVVSNPSSVILLDLTGFNFSQLD